jgi:hypothetical protein
MTSDALLTGLWRHHVGVAYGALVLWLAAVAVILLVPRAHVAQGSVAPAGTTGIPPSSLLSPLPQLGSGLIEQRPSGNFAVYLGALRGRETATVLRRAPDLADRRAAERAKDPFSRALARLASGGDEILDDDLMAWLRRNTSATQNPDSVLWTIEARHPGPMLALVVPAALAGSPRLWALVLSARRGEEIARGSVPPVGTLAGGRAGVD